MPPLVGVAVNVAEDPAHIGLVPVVCATVTEGVTLELTATTVVPGRLVHPLTVTVTLYVPAIAAVAEGRLGF